MNRILTRGRVASIAILALVSTQLSAQLSSGGELDRYLAEQVRSTKIPGLVGLVVDADDVLYEQAFGVRSGSGDESMTPDTIFRIASMTKPIAATVIMMLVEEGKLDLDDPIEKYVPSFAERGVVASHDPQSGTFTRREAASPATIRQLLSHSSGLAYGFASDVIASISSADGAPPGDRLPLLYDPGTGWSYANGISIVASVAERIEGTGLDTLMRDRLFEPLGMTETSFIVRMHDNRRVAAIFSPTSDGSLAGAPNPIDIRSAVSGDGGLNSTARDYARFIQLFLNDGVAPNGTRLLSRDSIREMTRHQLAPRTVKLMDEPLPNLARAFPLGAGRDGFGLGFQVTGPHENTNERSPGSLAWAGIFNTEFWIDRERGIGGVLMMQYLPFYDDAAIKTLVGFEQRVYQGLD